MANPTLVATAKSSTANSYVTQAEATTYFDEQFATRVAEWTAASSAEKDRALIMATYRLEQESYDGIQTDTATPQALKWPRTGTTDEDGNSFDADVVPVIVKRATYEMALALLKGQTELQDTGLEGFVNVQIGPLNVTPRIRSGGALPAQIRRLLRPVLWDQASRLVRN